MRNNPWEPQVRVKKDEKGTGKVVKWVQQVVKALDQISQIQYTS